MSDVSQQQVPSVKQAENEKRHGEEFGGPQFVRAAEKRLEAAKGIHPRPDDANEPGVGEEFPVTTGEPPTDADAVAQKSEDE